MITAEKAASPRVVLLADPDRAQGTTFATALTLKGYKTIRVSGGSAAIEALFLNHPDLVVYDWACPDISPRRLIEILRSNPGTESVPLVFTGAPAGGDDRVAALGESRLPRGTSVLNFLQHVETVFRRTDTARKIMDTGRHLEGDLAQMGIPDLVQIFGMNRRSGRLSVEGENVRGAIFLDEGRVSDAEAGRARGVKAFCRLLSLREGRFSFDPDGSSGGRTIDSTLDGLLMEGMRQLDELERLLAGLPATGRFTRDPAADVRPAEQHPTVREVLSVLEFNPALGELLDSCRATDFEVASALASLLRAGIARHKAASGESAVSPAAPSAGDLPPLLLPDEAARVRRWVRSRRARLQQISRAKILVSASRPHLLKSFIRRLRGLREFALHGSGGSLNTGFGTMGTMTLNDETVFAVVALPASKEAMPLKNLLGVGGAYAIVLATAAEREAAVTCAKNARANGIPPDAPIAEVFFGGQRGETGGGPESVLASISTAGVNRPQARFDLSRPDDVRQLVRKLLLSAVEPPFSATDRPHPA